MATVKRATLFNPTTGQRTAVDVGSKQSRDLFSAGYQLETAANNPTTQKRTLSVAQPAPAAATAPTATAPAARAPLPMASGERETMIKRYTDAGYSAADAEKRVGELTASRTPAAPAAVPMGATIAGIRTDETTTPTTSTAPGTSTLDMASTPPTTKNPYTSYNDAVKSLLEQAQKSSGNLDEDLLKQRNALITARFNTRADMTPEELRFLSPEQQSSLRNGDVSGLNVQLGGVDAALKSREASRTEARNYLKDFTDSYNKQFEPTQIGNNLVALNPETGEYEIKYKGEAEKTAAIRDYEYAQSTGYSGSFTDYQKEQLASQVLGASGLTSGQTSTILQVIDDIDKSEITKNFNLLQGKAAGMEGILQSGVSGPGDLALVYDFMKALDPTSVVRESEFATAQNSGNIFAGAFAKFNGYFASGGGSLPQNVREEFLNIMNSRLDVARQQYDNYRAEKGKQIEQLTGLPNGIQYITNFGDAISGVTGDSGDGSSGGSLDLSSYEPMSSVTDALTNRVKTDAQGNPLSSEEIDYLSRYATMLARSGKTKEETLDIINGMLRGEAPTFSGDLSTSQNGLSIGNVLNSFKAKIIGAIRPADKVVDVKLGNKTVKINGAVADRFAAADREYFAATGKHIPVSESFRTAERQQELYRTLSARGARVAPQGHSFHELGMAVDVGDAWKDVKPYLNKYGFVNGLANDMGHFSVGELA